MQALHYGVNRVGQLEGIKDIRKGLGHLPHVQFIDASVCVGSWWEWFKFFTANHSYFHLPNFKASIKRVIGADWNRWDAPGCYCPEAKPWVHSDPDVYKLLTAAEVQKMQASHAAGVRPNGNSH